MPLSIVHQKTLLSTNVDGTSRWQAAVLQASLIDPEEETKDNDTSFIGEKEWKQIKEINNKFWDYTCNFLYITIGLGIVLNLSGWAYTISPEQGLKIIPVSQHREEKLWKIEMQRYEIEAQQKKATLMQQMEISTIDTSSLNQ
jgi:hypothetical protein